MKTFRDFGIDVPDQFTGEKYTTCPKCSPTRKKKTAKCLSVNGDKGVWKCNHPECSWTGTLLEGKPDNSTQVHRQQPKTFSRPKYESQSAIPRKVVDYFASRCIPEDILEKYSIGYEKVWMPQLEKQVMAIAFPYFREGEVINVKHRDGRKNFRQTKGAEKIVYGLDCIQNQKEFIFTEGEIDKLTWSVLGLPCISVPDGAPDVETKNYESKFDYLVSIEEHVKQAEKIYLAFDSDGPGKKLEEEISRRIGREKCWKIKYPENCKDANSVAMDHGYDILYECYEAAEQYPVPGLIEIDSRRIPSLKSPFV